MEFKQGEVVMHVNRGKGIFLRYDVFDGEAVVEFTDEDGYKDELRVSTHLLKSTNPVDTNILTLEQVNELLGDTKWSDIIGTDSINFTYEYCPILFAIEQVTIHYTENETKETEPILHNVYKMFGFSDSVTQLLDAMDWVEIEYLREVIRGELKFFEENLSDNPSDTKYYKHARIMVSAYQEAYNYLVTLKQPQTQN